MSLKLSSWDLNGHTTAPLFEYITKSIYPYDKRLIAWVFLIEKGLYFDLLKKSMMLLYDVS